MNKVSRRGILSHGELNLILLWAARQSAEENVPAVSRVCLAQVANTCNPFTGSVDRLGPHRLWLRSTFDEIPNRLRKKGCRDIDSVQAPRFYDLGKDFGCLAGGSQIVFRAVGYTATSAYVA